MFITMIKPSTPCSSVIQDTETPTLADTPPQSSGGKPLLPLPVKLILLSKCEMTGDRRLRNCSRMSEARDPGNITWT